jgi:Cu(I)/Ag(I) efflux system membrane fusion protein/cobalt-zinc-cadmium efflux system membrane fusion protein
MKHNKMMWIVAVAALTAGFLGATAFWQWKSIAAPELDQASAAVAASDSGAVEGSAGQGGSVDPGTGKKIKYWVAPMDPTYIRQEPGKSPMGMDLVPVYEEEGEADLSSTATIRVDPVTVQNMGVRTAPVQRKTLTRAIRAYGSITYDERRLYTVNTKFDGWIEKLYVAFEGQPVAKGQPLLEIYSPDLVSAQQEFLLALDQYERLAGSEFGEVRRNAARLLEASRTRLRYWDVSDEQIKRLEKRKSPEKVVTVYSPATGVVLKKEAFQGHYVKAGQHQFEIADLSRVWVDVEVYEYELPWVYEGMPAQMELSYLPGRTFSGKVLFIYPYLSEKTRTARLRLEFANPVNELKPQMYANVHLKSRAAEPALVVAQEAVIDSGARKMVFVSKGEGRFEPREITVGPEGDQGEYQVLSGLSEGEIVVTSAQFMLDSESRLREAVQKMLALRDTDHGAAQGPDPEMDLSAERMPPPDELDLSGITMESGDDDLKLKD